MSDWFLRKTTSFAENDFPNHSRDAHCNEYLAQQHRCCAEPQSGSAERFAAFRHQIIIINRVARKLAESPNDTIGTGEFRSACYACGVDPDSFTQSDLDQLQRKLNEIT